MASRTEEVLSLEEERQTKEQAVYRSETKVGEGWERTIHIKGAVESSGLRRVLYAITIIFIDLMDFCCRWARRRWGVWAAKDRTSNRTNLFILLYKC